MKEKLNLSEYDLFIVDFDGTIADTMQMWRNICPNFILSLNRKPLDDIYLKITSKTNIEIAQFVRDEYFPEYSYEEIIEMFFDFIRHEYVKQELKPNAIKLLKDLGKHGKVVLYSATAKSVLDVLLDKFDLHQFYDNFYSGSDLGLTKRDGSGYLEVIKLAGGCKKALILEDAPHAIIGAKNQNLDVLAILDYCNINHLDILEEHAKYIVDLNNY